MQRLLCWAQALLLGWCMSGGAGAAEIPEINDSEGRIIRLEYYFDEDPGQGQGTVIDFEMDAEGKVSLELEPDISGLAFGGHALFLRALNGRGEWSHLVARRFFISPLGIGRSAPELKAAEYFFGADPGEANGVAISLDSDPRQVSSELEFDASDLGVGGGSIAFRTQDATGHWSLIRRKYYYSSPFNLKGAPSIVAAEYFIGEDPGRGNGLSLDVGDGIGFSPADQDMLDQLGFGGHSIGVRLQDEQGHWSHTTVQRIFRMPSFPATGIEWSLREGETVLQSGIQAVDPPQENFIASVDTGMVADSTLPNRFLTLEARLVLLEKIPTDSVPHDFSIEMVVDPLLFLSQPQPVAVIEGDPIMLVAEVGGTAPFSYQWWRNGNPIPGATDERLSIASAALSDAGLYSVIVTDAFGEITSEVARVDVEAAPVVVTGHVHPADRNEDWELSISEVAAYGAAWKRGEAWPVEPSEIPISYVTRAGSLWKTGEAYEFDSAIASAPLWWVSRSAGLQRNSVNRGVVTADRREDDGVMEITIQPNPSVRAYAYEEVFEQAVDLQEVPTEATLSEDGRRLRWGPFMDGQAREFRYRIDEAAFEGANNSRFGILSYDGFVQTVPAQDSANEAVVADPIIAFDARLGGLRVSGVFSQKVEIQSKDALESSEWRTVETLIASENSFLWLDPWFEANSIRFYRVQVTDVNPHDR